MKDHRNFREIDEHLIFGTIITVDHSAKVSAFCFEFRFLDIVTIM